MTLLRKRICQPPQSVRVRGRGASSRRGRSPRRDPVPQSAAVWRGRRQRHRRVHRDRGGSGTGFRGGVLGRQWRPDWQRGKEGRGKRWPDGQCWGAGRAHVAGDGVGARIPTVAEAAATAARMESGGGGAEATVDLEPRRRAEEEGGVARGGTVAAATAAHAAQVAAWGVQEKKKEKTRPASAARATGGTCPAPPPQEHALAPTLTPPPPPTHHPFHAVRTL